jgi:glyoxylase-like metal-dependent hydrolase (beta-lactamase superfamily II)
MARYRELLAATAALWLAISAPALAQETRQPSRAALATGVYTYSGQGTVNTYWIETPGGGLVVIDVQRDLTHARAALAAVKATGKPVRAILITHGHPDHYAGVGLFKAAFPDAVVWASQATDRTMRGDSYGYNKLMRDADGEDFPARITPADRTFDGDADFTIDGLRVVAREMGKAEANSATVYDVPATGDLYVGDLVLNHLHPLFGEAATTEWLAALERLDVLFPNARTVHPGHGASGPKSRLLGDERTYIEGAREIAAEAIVAFGATKTGEAEAAKALRARYPYGNPSGLPDHVERSIHGLFTELATPALAPTK